MREWIDIASLGIEWLAVIAIVGSILFGSLRFLVRIAKVAKDPFKEYKELIGNSLLTTDEFDILSSPLRCVFCHEEGVYARKDVRRFDGSAPK